jgi:hypothetical protein
MVGKEEGGRRRVKGGKCGREGERVRIGKGERLRVGKPGG